MVVWSVAVMCTTLRLRVRSKSSPGAGRGHPPFQAVLVDADLAVDRAQVVGDPGQVEVAVPSVAGAGPGGWRQQQAVTLVVAQRVGGETRGLGRLGDRVAVVARVHPPSVGL